MFPTYTTTLVQQLLLSVTPAKWSMHVYVNIKATTLKMVTLHSCINPGLLKHIFPHFAVAKEVASVVASVVDSPPPPEPKGRPEFLKCKYLIIHHSPGPFVLHVE